MESQGLNILVAFDGSDLALEAVKYVATLMPAQSTRVVLFYIETKMSNSFWKVEHDMDFRFKAGNIRSCIAQQHKRINSSMETAHQILVEAGFDPDAVTKKIQAKNLGIVNDLFRESHEGYHAVVIGRKGESKIKDMLVGSVPNKLLKKIQGIPLIIVGGALKQNRILVSFDGSKEIMRAVKSMSALIGASDCKISFCLVSRGKGTPVEKEEVRKKIEPMINKAKECLVDSGYSFNQVSFEMIDAPQDLSNSIVEKANQGSYDTIVIGRRGLSIYQEFISRRVGNKIFQQAQHLTVWVLG